MAMNNEPVAWMVNNKSYEEIFEAEHYSKFTNKPMIPLYTHPVKEYKEPSVKEIDDLWLSVINNIPANDHRPREWHFARAILRKAQENG